MSQHEPSWFLWLLPLHSNCAMHSIPMAPRTECNFPNVAWPVQTTNRAVILLRSEHIPLVKQPKITLLLLRLHDFPKVWKSFIRENLFITLGLWTHGLSTGDDLGRKAPCQESHDQHHCIGLDGGVQEEWRSQRQPFTHNEFLVNQTSRASYPKQLLGI